VEETMHGSGDSAMTGVTLWRQIADELERAILRGEHAPGARMPGEIEIAQRFGVNRHTVRRALGELGARGLVRAERGSGTFVEGGRLPYRIGTRTRFSENVGASGRQPGGRLVMSAVEEAAPDIAARLGLAAGATVVRLEILRGVDRVPIAIGTHWLPAARVPKAVQRYRETRSLTRTLKLAGIPDYRRQSTRISGTIVDALDAARLRLLPGRPLMVIDSVDVTPDGVPILTTHARFAADRVELVVESP
jgi:GntR family phosphonate transport system transcriptional regulator